VYKARSLEWPRPKGRGFYILDKSINLCIIEYEPTLLPGYNKRKTQTMKKLILVFAVIFGFAVSVNAQSDFVPYTGFGIAQKPAVMTIDSLVEDRLGVVTVYFTCDDFPVKLSVNGQDTITVTKHMYKGQESFDAEPEFVKGGGPYTRIYTAYAQSKRVNTYREKCFYHPPTMPIN
jgi:hypothetical protein